MAIKENNESLVHQFIDMAVILYNYTSGKNMIENPNYDSKYSIKLGKVLDEIVKKIIGSPTDMEEFVTLIDNKELLIAYLSAEYLYPVCPDKCLKIMENFYKKIDNKIDKFTVKTKIEGLKNHEPFFMDTYKKLYGCNDLDLLNREKEL